MIVEGHGDLLAADADALVNTVNCVGVMGKGIALQFKRSYPKVFDAYAKACKLGEVEIGLMLPVATNQITGPRYVINFPTKKHWRSPSNIRYIQEGLVDLRRVVHELGLRTVAIPPLGSGNGGLDWNDVEPLIRDEFESDANVTILLFAPSTGTREIAAKVDVRVTPFRALVLQLISAYAAQRQASEPWEDPYGVSHLEIQKLVYFGETLQPEIRLQFVAAHYGPYSDSLRHVLQDMEGALTIGLGDGSGHVLDFEPIRLTPAGENALAEFLASNSKAANVSELATHVLKLVEGFEGPYGLELLASTHWVSAATPGLPAEAAAGRVRSWTGRKGRLFTDQHVSTALDHLVETSA